MGRVPCSRHSGLLDIETLVCTALLLLLLLGRLLIGQQLPSTPPSTLRTALASHPAFSLYFPVHNHPLAFFFLFGNRVRNTRPAQQQCQVNNTRWWHCNVPLVAHQSLLYCFFIGAQLSFRCRCYGFIRAQQAAPPVTTNRSPPS